MADGIARRVWRFSDGSSIEFEAATKQITNHGGGLSVGAILRVRDAIPDMVKIAKSQDEMDDLIIGRLDLLLK